MLLPPPDSSGTSATVARHGGLAGWEIALIAVGVVILVSFLIHFVLRGRAAVRLQRA
jgi:hypothetical protein